MLGNVGNVKQKEAIAALQQAMEKNDKEGAKKAWEMFSDALAATVREDYEMYNTDKTVLAQRGYRQLTQKEEEFYQKLIKAGKADDPKQAFTDLLRIEGGMPETIIQDVYKDLMEQHPLLNKINFQNVKYLTKWILNDHTKQTAAWGPINNAVKEEIESAFTTIDVAMNKLSAFAVIPKDMLDLGPVFLDNYIRTILREALYCALEKAIIAGTGKDQPIGLIKDIHKGVTVSTETGYPDKAAVKVSSFLPTEYGKVLAKLAVSENGRMRTFDSVTMVCNQVDYLTKVMPATTVLNAGGAYTKDVFPFPTEVVRSNEVTTGQAIVFLPEEYFFGLGESKDGTITFDDSYKFLEDARVYLIKLHGNGRAYDNTVAVVLDISDLDPAYITVLNKTEPIVA